MLPKGCDNHAVVAGLLLAVGKSPLQFCAHQAKPRPPARGSSVKTHEPEQLREHNQPISPIYLMPGRPLLARFLVTPPAARTSSSRRCVQTKIPAQRIGGSPGARNALSFVRERTPGALGRGTRGRCGANFPTPPPLLPSPSRPRRGNMVAPYRTCGGRGLIGLADRGAAGGEIYDESCTDPYSWQGLTSYGTTGSQGLRPAPGNRRPALKEAPAEVAKQPRSSSWPVTEPRGTRLSFASVLYCTPSRHTVPG